jgi:hypothetical protein
MPCQSNMQGADKLLDAAYLALTASRDAHKPSDRVLSIIGDYSDNHLREFRKELGYCDGKSPRRLMSLAAIDKSWAQNLMDDHPFLQKVFEIVCPEDNSFRFKALPCSNLAAEETMSLDGTAHSYLSYEDLIAF